MRFKSNIKIVVSAVLVICILISLVTFTAMADSAPRLISLTLDGGYKLEFTPEKLDYTVFLPNGRPRVPRISAEADNSSEVKIYNAALADKSDSALGYVVVDNGTTTAQYTIKFKKYDSEGFVLQYDDRYTFTPAELTGTITFLSDNPEVASVDSKGVITIKKISNDPVTITASDASNKTEELKIERTIKAQVDLIMSVGQSNAYGMGGNGSAAEKILPGTGYDMGYDGDTQRTNTRSVPIALRNTENSGTGVSGVRQAFTKRWYDLTGEKTLFINAADPGINIASWQSNGAAYKGAKTEYLRVKNIIETSENFEIYRTFYYFNHGSADVGTTFNTNYYNDVLNTFNLLRQECDMEFGSIFEYFSSDRAYTSYARSTHNELSYDYDDIFVGAVMKEEIQQNRSFINSDNLHLTQAGHDRCGELLAEGTFAQALFPDGETEQGGEALSPKKAPALNLAASSLESVSDIGALQMNGSRDWLVEFDLKLNSGVEKYTVLSNEDGAEISVQPKSNAKGIVIKTQSGSITLSAGDSSEFYKDNIWRLYYDADLQLVYLYKNNVLQSNEIFSDSFTLSAAGQLNGKASANFDSLKVWYGEKNIDIYDYRFEKTLDVENNGASLESDGGMMLSMSKNTYKIDPITLSKDSDWSFEIYGSAASDISWMGSANNASNIFVNFPLSCIRVRYGTGGSEYSDLPINKQDLASLHEWKIEYVASENKIYLSKDDEIVSSAAFNANMTFNQLGVSGSTGGDNSAKIDYIEMKQDGVNKGSADVIRFDFENSLSDNSGNYVFTLSGGTEQYTARPVQSSSTMLSLSKNTYTITPITLKKDSDWSFETYGSFADELSLLGTADNSSNIYVNFSVPSIRVRYGTGGSEYADLVANKSEYGVMHKWRVDYSASEKKIKLYMDDALVNTANFNADMTFNRLGVSGSTGVNNSAKLDYIDINQTGVNKNGENEIRFDFENSLSDNSGEYTFVCASGAVNYEKSDIIYPFSGRTAINFSKNKYSVDNMTFNKNSDWTFETYTAILDEISLLGTADNSSNIYVNFSVSCFRIRYGAGNAYVDLLADKSEFSSFHTWSVAYKASEKKIYLYMDGALVSSADFNADMTFDQVGVSGTTGGNNSAKIDYLKLEQTGINKSSQNVILFDFENTLSDNSGNYTLALKTGTTGYENGDIGYYLTPSTTLKTEESIVLAPENNWNLSFKTIFDVSDKVSLIDNVITADKSGIYVGNVLFAANRADMESLNKWTVENNEGTVSLYFNDKLISSKAFADALTISTFGSSGTAFLYSLKTSVYYDAPEARGDISISGDAQKGGDFTAQLTSDFWAINEESISYQWLRNGAPIGNAVSKTYTITDADTGTQLSCMIFINGSNDVIVSTQSAVIKNTGDTSTDENDAVSPTKAAVVKASVESGAVKSGTKITLTTQSENAVIKYSINGGAWKEYTESEPVKLTEFPAVLRVYASGEYLLDGSVSEYTYTELDDSQEPVPTDPVNPIPDPNTGDFDNTMYLLGVMMVLIAVMAALMIINRKKRNNI